VRLSEEGASSGDDLPRPSVAGVTVRLQAEALVVAVAISFDLTVLRRDRDDSAIAHRTPHRAPAR